MPQALNKIARLLFRATRFALREPWSALLVLRMAFWVMLLSFFVKLSSLTRTLRLMTPRRRFRAPKNTDEIQWRIARLLDLLLATDFWVFRPNCWKRAAVLHRFLALQGIETRIVFGVRKGGDEGLDGHAWLEAAGLPVLETTTPDYKVTFSYPV